MKKLTHYHKLLLWNKMEVKDLPDTLQDVILQAEKHEQEFANDKKISILILEFLKESNPKQEIITYEESLKIIALWEDDDEGKDDEPVKCKGKENDIIIGQEWDIVHGFEITNHDNVPRKAVIGVFGYSNKVNYGSESGIEIKSKDGKEFGQFLKAIAAAPDFKVEAIDIHCKNEEQLGSILTKRVAELAGVKGEIKHIVPEVEGNNAWYECKYTHSNVDSLEIIVQPKTALSLNIINNIRDMNQDEVTEKMLDEVVKPKDEPTPESKEVKEEKTDAEVIITEANKEEKIPIPKWYAQLLEREGDKFIPEWMKESVKKFRIEQEGEVINLPLVVMTQNKHDEIINRLKSLEERLSELESKKWWQSNKPSKK